MRNDRVADFAGTIQAFRHEQGMFAELKWTRVSSQKLPQYRRFVEYFFALNNTNRLQFHCIIIDNHLVDHRRFSHGDKELGFYKFYYQFLLHRFGALCVKQPDARFMVHLDDRTSRYSLATLKLILNRGGKKRYGIDCAPFVAVEPRDSKEVELLQVCDVLLGAIGFQKNGYDLVAGAKASKVQLAQHVAQQAGLPDLKADTRRGQMRFTIWNFRLQKKDAP